MEFILLSQFFLSFLVLLLNIKEFYCREINFTINPKCENECTIQSGCDPVNCEKPWLIYGIGNNGNNSIHYLWSFMDLPTFIMLSSTNDSEIIIDWTSFTNRKPNSISFHPLPQSTFGISFQSIILFNDVNDTGTLENIPEEFKKFISMDKFEWIFKNIEKNNSDEWTINFVSSKFRNEVLNDDTGIEFKLTSNGKFGRSDILPHLITTPENTQVVLLLKNLLQVINDASISTSEHLRFGFDTIILSSDIGKNFTYANKKSLDDEFTPGVFDLSSIASHSALVSSIDNSKGGYLQWRPVCYLTSERDINYSTVPNLNSSLPPIDSSHMNSSHKSLVYALFGNRTDELLGAETTVAFGQPKDGFYVKYNYTEWTFSLGLGILPEETFSTLVIIVICVGVGLPLLLVIMGVVYLAFKRSRRSSEGDRLLEE